jgi:hypothetical protein
MFKSIEREECKHQTYRRTASSDHLKKSGVITDETCCEDIMGIALAGVVEIMRRCLPLGFARTGGEHAQPADEEGHR